VPLFKDMLTVTSLSSLKEVHASDEKDGLNVMQRFAPQDGLYGHSADVTSYTPPVADGCDVIEQLGRAPPTGVGGLKLGDWRAGFARQMPEAPPAGGGTQITPAGHTPAGAAELRLPAVVLHTP
jgi:hypothetical protein